jgi:site-specific DNA-methyltransferase (adenine-specific)
MEDLLGTITLGNNLDILKQLPDNSIDSIVTDPPYSFDPVTSVTWDGADPRRSEKDKKTYQQRVANGVNYNLDLAGRRRFQTWCEEWAREILRVLKPGAHGFVFGASKMNHRVACGLEDAGFDVKDVLVWGYATGTPKGNRDITASVEALGGSTGGALGNIIKPAYEPMTLIRKPLSESNMTTNFMKWGVGGIWIDEGRTPYEKPPAARKLSKKDQETIVNKDKVVEAHPLGRWPASIVLTDPILEERWNPFFMVAKPNAAEKTHNGQVDNTHSTIKPIHLMEQLIRMVTPKGGTCIDPFAGSGTTLVACKRLGVQFIGMELDASYQKTALERLAATDVEV